jgi:hypothetical protein
MRKLLLLVALAAPIFAQPKVSPEKEASMKADLVGQIDAMKKQAQVMVDSVFSFGELGFQEFETTKYLTGVLEKEGFNRAQLRRHSHRLGGELGLGQAGDLAWAAISTTSRRRRRSPAWGITTRLWKALRATAKGTIPACR